jgi:hypothetical protein
MPFDQYTGLYFFSALFQGDIAFLALSGVFVVYRLQIITQAMGTKETEIVELISQPFKSQINQVPEEMIAAFQDIGNLFKHLDEYENKLVAINAHWKGIATSLANDKKLQLLARQREELDRIRKLIVERTFKPFASMVAIVLVTLVGLPLATAIHSTGAISEASVFAVVVLLNAYAIVINARFSLQLLQNKVAGDTRNLVSPS